MTSRLSRLRNSPAVITLTERAAGRIKELLNSKNPKPKGIKIGVRVRGCNGMSYTINYVDDDVKLPQLSSSTSSPSLMPPSKPSSIPSCTPSSTLSSTSPATQSPIAPSVAPSVVEQYGVTVMVEPRALLHILGTTLDWKEDRLKSEFVFINPNEKGRCGCGESFNTG